MPTPYQLFGSGYAASSSTHTITLNTSNASSDPLLIQITDTEANADSGDGRRVVYGLLEMLYQHMAELNGTEAYVTGEFSWGSSTTGVVPSVKIVPTRSSYEDTNGELVRTYKFIVRTTVTGLEVSDE